MFWVSKVIAPLALVAGIAATTTAVFADGDGNQPPFGGKGGFGQPPFGGKGGFGQPGKGGDDKKGGEKGDKKDDKKVEE